MKPVLLLAFYSLQAAILIVAGCATLWWADSLMLWLIWTVGEERALGAESVVHLEGGGRLLTNPGAMILWSIPFWILGCVQISAGATLLHDCYRRIAAGRGVSLGEK